ncbi:50S ribosomal protein L17 [Candidatus Vidania fulgoroideae]|nr:50S ribosomal protein L17 [Candidatus Vidania fulgoroideae]
MRHRKKKKYSICYSQKKNIFREHFKIFLTNEKLLIRKKNFSLFKKAFFKNIKKKNIVFKKKVYFCKVGPRRGDKSEMIFVFAK